MKNRKNKKSKKTSVETSGVEFEIQTKKWIRKHYSNQILSLEQHHEIQIPSEDMARIYIKNAEEVIRTFKQFNSKYVFDFKVVLKNGKQIFIESKSRQSKCYGKQDSKIGLNKDTAIDGAIIRGRILKLSMQIQGIKDYEYIVVSNAFPKITNNNYLKLVLAMHIDDLIHEVVILDSSIENRSTLDHMFV